jgi:hypothetical protein
VGCRPEFFFRRTQRTEIVNKARCSRSYYPIFPLPGNPGLVWIIMLHIRKVKVYMTPVKWIIMLHTRKVKVYITPVKGVGRKVMVTKNIFLHKMNPLDGNIKGRLQPHHTVHPPEPESMCV